MEVLMYNIIGNHLSKFLYVYVLVIIMTIFDKGTRLELFKKP